MSDNVHIPLYHMLFEVAKELRNKATDPRSCAGKPSWHEMKYSAGAIFFACACLESWANALVNDRSLVKNDGSFKWSHGRTVQERLAELQRTEVRGNRKGWEVLSLRKKWLKLTEIIDPQGRAAFRELQEPFSGFAELIDIRNKQIAHHKAEIATDPSTLPEVSRLTADWAKRACEIVVKMCNGIEKYGGDAASSVAWWCRDP